MSIMQSNRIYFPVYKSIEKEVLELTSAIHFTDKQINVYSLKIADLILRCSIELESLAKDIYREEMGKDPGSPGECINWLEENRKISKKSIIIASHHFHFDKIFNPYFCPFDYKNDSEDDYHAIYNAIKHDRVKNLHKATINVLIRVLGSLYILNVYYKNLNIVLDDDYIGDKLDKSGGSEIFNFMVYPSEEASIFTINEGIALDSCIYKIEKHIGDFCINIKFKDEHDKTKSWNCLMINKPFQSFAQKKQGQKITLDDMFKIISEFTDINIEEQKKELYEKFKIKEIIEVKPSKMRDYYHAVLNR